MPQPILAGIPAGGMKETYEVKILLCYLLASLDAPLSRENLAEICTSEGIVDYFTLCTALGELEQNGNIAPLGMDDNAPYALTPLGREAVEHLKTALPSSLRDAIVQRGMALLARIRRRNEVNTEIKPDGSGFRVFCTLHEGDFTFFTLTLYAPDREQAEILAANFRRKAPEIYEGLIGILIQ